MFRYLPAAKSGVQAEAASVDRQKSREILTAKKVEKLRKPGRYRDALTTGLYLQVSDRGAKSWVLRYELHGRERMMGLGPASAFSLKEARGRARLARKQLVDGIDPLQVKQETRAAAQFTAARRLTFREAAERYVIQHRAEWRSVRHAKEFASTLQRYAYPTIGNQDVAGIETADILRAVEPIWQTRTATAKRTLNRIEMILNWATARGHRPAGHNPARWREHLDQVLAAPRKIAKPQRFAALSYVHLPAFMAQLRACEGIAARALEFTILTAARSGEVLGATWPEFDLDNSVWTISAGRMKGDREHRVPLAPATLAVLRALPHERGNPFVFIGAQVGRGLDKNSMTRVLAHLGHGDVTVHGFRSSFSDWAHERTAHSNHVIELSLAHSIGTAVEQAYRRSDLFAKRRQLIEAWAKFCSTPLLETAAVTPLRAVP
jgi:integrase